MFFYILLHSVCSYRMHVFRMLHFTMSDCIMMHCLMKQLSMMLWCSAYDVAVNNNVLHDYEFHDAALHIMPY